MFTLAAVGVLSTSLGVSTIAATPTAAAAVPQEGFGVVINEAVSNGGSPDDWIEFYNAGDTAADLSGYTVRDNQDDNSYVFPAGTTVGPNEYLVIDHLDGDFGHFDFGLGKGDSVRLYDPLGELIDERSWPDNEHAVPSFGLDAAGVWRVTTESTKDAVNEFAEAEVPFAVRINEAVSNGGSPDDWIEFYNAGITAVDLGGYRVQDNGDKNPYSFPAGTVIEPGAYLVIDTVTDGAGDFDFGLGKGDSVRLFDPAGELLEERTWSDGEHALPSYGVDAAGVWRQSFESTKGAANVFVDRQAFGVRINEVVSNSGNPDDWIEFYNHSETAVDLSGYVLKDNSDSSNYVFPQGTIVEPGAYLVLDTLKGGFGDFDFGLGKGDSVRLFDPAGELIDARTWPDGEHAFPSYGIDEAGEWRVTGQVTKGALNNFEQPEPPAPLDPWNGQSDVSQLDIVFTHDGQTLDDVSGLDSQQVGEDAFLWVVNNKLGAFWKLEAYADGSVAFAPGWEDGKRAQFKSRQGEPDSEGITVDSEGFVYLASERDNFDDDINWNTVLKLDPNKPGPEVVADQEWDLTSLLPTVSANRGIEAVEWVSDEELTGALFDTNTNAAYDPAVYSGKADGVFFVGFEDNGHVYGFAFNPDGTAQLIAEILPGMQSVMALDWDSVSGGLWAVCDNTCNAGAGATTFIEPNGTAAPALSTFAQPAGLPAGSESVANFEGFATAPAVLMGDPAPAAISAFNLSAAATGESRPAWWTRDGHASGALFAGSVFSVPTAGTGTGGGTGTDAGPGNGSGAGGAGGDSGAAPGAGVNVGEGSLADTGGETLVPLIVGIGLLVALGGGLIAYAKLAAHRRRDAHLSSAAQ